MINKMRIFVVEPDGTGGLIHYAYQLCTALADNGADVTLITAADYELENLRHNFRVVKLLHLWKRFDDEDSYNKFSYGLYYRFRKLYVKFRRAFRAVRWVLAWLRLTIFLYRSKPDLVQFSKMYFSFESYFIGFLCRHGIVATQICHEFEEREGQGWLEAMLLGVRKDVYSYFSAIFFHAHENRNRFLLSYPSISSDHTYVINHGNSSWLLNFNPQPGSSENLKKKYALREGERVVLFFGLLAPSKGLEDLLNAFSIVSRSCAAKLVVAGYPTKYINIKDLMAKAVELGIDDQVFFDLRYIPLNEIKPLMELATVVVYPYRSSTQSGALQTAYTFGKPVIATKVGGLPEAVENGRNGFLVPAESPKDLAEKIVSLVEDPGLAKEMGAYAKYLSETRFSWGAVAKSILEVYKDLVVNNVNNV